MPARMILSTLLLLLNMQIASSLMINEMMYNPSIDMGDDSDLEWIELYVDGDGAVLSDYTLNVSGKSFALPNMTLEADSYLIIARELIDSSDADNDSFSGYYGMDIPAIDIDFILSNMNGNIALYRSGTLIHQLNYTNSMGADGNGFSLELFNGSLVESRVRGGTPGMMNSYFVIMNGSINVTINDTIPIDDTNITDTTTNMTNTTDTTNMTNTTKGLRLSVYAGDVLYTGMVYDKLFKIENLDHVSGIVDCIDAMIKYEITYDGSLLKVDFIPVICLNSVKTANTGEFITAQPGIYQLCGEIKNESNMSDLVDHVCKNITVVDAMSVECDISIQEIVIDRFIYAEKEKVGYDIVLNNETFPFMIKYSITDLFGAVIKKEAITMNTNKKSFTPSGLKESDKVYSINAEVIPSCNDTNSSNNRLSEFLVVKRTSKQATKSNITIKQMTTKEPKFGADVVVSIEIYKGDTAKTSVHLFAETEDGKKLSEITRINVKSKFTSYDFTIPVVLKGNCDKKYPAGYYFITAEGLDAKERYRFRIGGWSKECEQLNKTKAENKTDTTKKNATTSKTKESSAVNKTSSKTDLKSSPASDSSQAKNETSEADRLTGMTVYRSASMKSNGLLPVIFFIASGLLCLLLILKML